MRPDIERQMPLFLAGQLSRTELEMLAANIRTALKEDPGEGKMLGPLFNQVNAALKMKASTAGIQWVSVGNGSLAIGHKPGGKISFEGMKNEGVSIVLTLLHENEGARQIGQQIQAAGMDWIWFPFSASSPHEGKSVSEVLELFDNINRSLQQGSRIYIHCSAGIHRTGMITYGLLRYIGKDASEARQLLHALRTVTAEGVGDNRLAWGEQFGAE